MFNFFLILFCFFLFFQTVHNQIVQEYRKIKKVKSLITTYEVKTLLFFDRRTLKCFFACRFPPSPRGLFSPIPTTTRRRVAASISTTSSRTSRSSYRSTTSSSSAPGIRAPTELFHSRDQHSLAAKMDVSAADLEIYTSARHSGKKQP